MRIEVHRVLHYIISMWQRSPHILTIDSKREKSIDFVAHQTHSQIFLGQGITPGIEMHH